MFLEATAIFAKKIKFYNEKQEIKNYLLLLVLFYNGIFSTILSILGSSFLALFLLLLTKNFLTNWLFFLKIMLILNILMLLLNLLSKELNIPMKFMQGLFSLRNKFKSIWYFFGFVSISYIALIIVIIIFCNLFFNIFIHYDVPSDNAFIYSIIISIGITVAAFYSFPVKKGDRDINELIVSPLFIVLNIGIGFVISKENILNNVRAGHEEMVLYIFVMFLVAASIQIISYFRKIFEKIHDFKGYEDKIDVYADNARIRLETIKCNLKKSVEPFNQLIKNIKKEKSINKIILTAIMISLILVTGLFFPIGQELFRLEIINLDKTVSKSMINIVMIGVILFLAYKVFILLFLSIKGKVAFSFSERWEFLGGALFAFGMLILIVVNILPINLNPIIITFSGICIMVSITILGINTFTLWLLKNKDE